MNSTKTAVLLVTLWLVIGVASAVACGCVGTPQTPPANDEELARRILARNEYVFIGKVSGFEYRSGLINSYLEERRLTNPLLTYETKFVNFSIERWYKGAVGPEESLRTEQTRNSDGTESDTSCEFHFQKDETYIVFADMHDGYLRTNNCTGTGLTSDRKDLKVLGEGHMPVKPKN